MLHCSCKIEPLDDMCLFDSLDVAPEREECIGLGLGPPHADFLMIVCPFTKHFSLVRFITGPSWLKECLCFEGTLEALYSSTLSNF